MRTRSCDVDVKKCRINLVFCKDIGLSTHSELKLLSKYFFSFSPRTASCPPLRNCLQLKRTLEDQANKRWLDCLQYKAPGKSAVKIAHSRVTELLKKNAYRVWQAHVHKCCCKKKVFSLPIRKCRLSEFSQSPIPYIVFLIFFFSLTEFI